MDAVAAGYRWHLSAGRAALDEMFGGVAEAL
jgi:hypothetical protein